MKNIRIKRIRIISSGFRSFGYQSADFRKAHYAFAWPLTFKTVHFYPFLPATLDLSFLEFVLNLSCFGEFWSVTKIQTNYTTNYVLDRIGLSLIQILIKGVNY